MIRTSTVVYLVLFLALVGAYFYFRDHAEQPADLELTIEPTVEVTYLFSAEEGTPSRIRLESNSGESVDIARNAENSWTLREPLEAAANQGAAEAAASQVTTMRILDTIPDLDPEIVGLDDPEYTLLVEFSNGAEKTVEIGIVTPTESGYYVRDVDGSVHIISKPSVDALLGLLDNPPYLETPTPGSTPAGELAVTPTATP